MITIRPFAAIRPKNELAKEVSIPPYDVLSDEASRKLGENPKSLIHITRSEVYFPAGEDPYTGKVYEKAKTVLEEFLAEGILFQDEEALYIYTEVYHNMSQRGIVGIIDTVDSKEGRIKIHELTLKEKQKDRTNHFYHLRCQDEPVLLFHKKEEELENWMKEYVQEKDPEFDFTDEAGVRHILHKINGKEDIEKVQNYYKEFDAVYIGDGHHRTASSLDVCERLQVEEGIDPGLLAVIFPEEELNILGYHRVIKDLNNLTREEFLEALKESFLIEKIDKAYEPKEKGVFVLLFKDEVYKMTLKEEPQGEKVADLLDASILQEKVLAPILDIIDIRTDQRIEFYGGYNAIDEIEEKIDQGFTLGILLHPVTPKDIIAVADRKEVMPPKSTWFEPKLRSGLFLYPYDI
ncbi:MAG: DUF1015 family protein [Tissierellia bacterium]|nr:DUF1015 family protein [Tissierellia bacterium]